MSQEPIGRQPVPELLKASLAMGILGAAASLALFLRAGPYTLVLFMFVGQPLLLLAFGSFVLSVLRDLRGRRVLP